MFGPTLYSLPAHAPHVRFAVALGVFVGSVPAAQFVHAAHVVFGPTLNSPGLHVSHTGADVGVPATLCSVPAAHEP